MSSSHFSLLPRLNFTPSSSASSPPSVAGGWGLQSVRTTWSLAFLPSHCLPLLPVFWAEGSSFFPDLCLLLGVFGLKKSQFCVLEAVLPLRIVGETLEEQFPVLQEPAIALTVDSYCLCFFKERLSFWVRVIGERIVTLFAFI